MTASTLRSWAPVRAGAFFPPADFQVPEKARRQHRRQPMVVPPGILPPCIMGPPQFGFPFFEALLHGPPHPAEPPEGPQGRAHWGLTERVCLSGLRPQGPLEHEPDGPLWEPVLTEREALAGQLRDDRSLGAFRDRAPIPARGRHARRDDCHGACRVVWGDPHALCACFSLLPGGLVRCGRALEPTAGLCRDHDEGGPPATRLHGGPASGTMALEASRDEILAREEPFGGDGLDHRRRPRRFPL
jgi:hypothetical protein